MSHPHGEEPRGGPCSRGAMHGGGRGWGRTAPCDIMHGGGRGQRRPYLPGSEGHFAVFAFAQLSELAEDGGQLIRQGRVWATELILWGRETKSKWLSVLPEGDRPAFTLGQGGGGVAAPANLPGVIHIPLATLHQIPPYSFTLPFIHPKTCPKFLA